MAALTDLSDLINLATGGGAAAPQTHFFMKTSRVGGAAAPATILGRPISLWRYDGAPCTAGVVPGAAAVPTSATAGALPFTNPGGGRELHLIQAWGTALVGGTLIVYDRLLHNGGLSGTVATAQTVGGTLTRNTGGLGNFMFVEIYTQIGTTATTIIANYTNQAGNPAVTPAVAFGGTNNREATRAIFLPLASGDSGVQGVTDVDLGVSTGTAGSFGVTVGKVLGYIGVGTGGAPGWRDYVTGLPGIPTIDSDACISFLWVPSSTVAPDVFGGISLVEK
jgi:hypothetical protein